MNLQFSKRIFSSLIFLSLLLNSTAVFGQNSETANNILTQLLRENSHPLIFEKGRLSGEGADFIFREAEKAQFFLIGEEHGIAENPLFAAAVLQELNRFGYKYFAAEIGQLSIERLQAAARNKPIREVLSDFNRRYPFSLPFFNWREEGNLLETALKLPRGKLSPVWGLDQEFFFSSVYHFERLRKLASTPRTKQIVDEYYEKVRTEFTNSVESKNPSGAFLVSAKAADFDKLEAVFGAKDTEARRIISDLRKSAEIYQKNFRGEQYANNLERSQLLKRRFMEYYNAALKTEKTPKVFFKFGAAHVWRGRNYVNVFDVGNLASEIAEANGLSSFHVLVLAASGTQNKFLPFVGNEADKQRKFNAENVYPYFDVRPFTALTQSTTGWQIIDLRPLRPHLGTKKLGNLPNGLSDLITGFDAVLLLREGTPATLFGL